MALLRLPFLLIHLLIPRGIGNINRDREGRPKTAFDGDTIRNYQSSQCNKYNFLKSISSRYNIDLGAQTAMIGRFFYDKLSELPHTQLTVNTNGFVSLWDGQQSDGCEVVFGTDESMVSGKVAHQKFESFINLSGWSLNEKLMADGPGSSTVGIENDGTRCLVKWSQPSWVDEKAGEIKQSDKIKIVVQCSSEQTKN